MVQESVHRYAVEVMRPIGIKLDRMTPEEVIAPGSPYWEAREKFLELGFGVEGLLELEPAERATSAPRQCASFLLVANGLRVAPFDSVGMLLS